MTHYVPPGITTIARDAFGRSLTACGRRAYLAESSAVPDCPACEKYLRSEARARHEDQQAHSTHYVPYWSRPNRHRQARAVCGYLTEHDQHSLTPSCGECQAHLAREAEETIESRFGPEPPYEPQPVEPRFNILAGYRPKKAR